MKLKQLIKLFKILWKERKNTNCRQKYKRIEREMEKQ